MKQMHIVSVNLGRAETIQHGNRSFTTGITKHAVSQSEFVTVAGLENDTICDNEHHGGDDQAVYAYSANDYEWWSEKLARDIVPGTFGENLTIAGLPHDMKAGDRLLIGDLILEATMPRIPCSTLAAAMQDSGFGLQFRYAERPGFYFRVLNEGRVSTGDSVTMVENPNESITMLELFRLSYEITPDVKILNRVLEAPIAERMRAKFESKIALPQA